MEFAGHRIPAGTPVIIGTTVPHGLPELFPDPERFDPDRFAPGRAEHRQPGAYGPFGVSTHICAGSGMAEGLIMLAAAAALCPREVLFPWVAPVGLLIGLGGTVGWLAYASYRDWKEDPAPEPVFRS